MIIRTVALAISLSLGATSLALAQSTSPTNSNTSPSNSSSSQMPNNTMNDGSGAMPANGNDKVGQDPKMKTCMASEKAKNTGQSDDQMKQKCMMQIGSHQGQSK